METKAKFTAPPASQAAKWGTLLPGSKLSHFVDSERKLVPPSQLNGKGNLYFPFLVPNRGFPVPNESDCLRILGSACSSQDIILVDNRTHIPTASTKLEVLPPSSVLWVQLGIAYPLSGSENTLSEEFPLSLGLLAIIISFQLIRNMWKFNRQLIIGTGKPEETYTCIRMLSNFGFGPDTLEICDLDTLIYNDPDIPNRCGPASAIYADTED